MAVDIDFESIKKRANKEFEKFNEKLKEYNISKKKLAFATALLVIAGVGLWDLRENTYENSSVPLIHKVIISPLHGVGKINSMLIGRSTMLIKAWEEFFDVRRTVIAYDD